jgi:ATP-dependent Zn protease
VLAATAQYSVGGKQDARNASQVAGKILDKTLYELLMLVEEKTGLNKEYMPEKIGFQCDFENASEEVREFYEGEKNCVIPVLTDIVPEKSAIKVFEKNQVDIRFFPERESFIEAVEKENVLFCVIDYNLGRSPEEQSLDIRDVSSEGSRAFFRVKEDHPTLPVYLFLDDGQYGYSEREKYNLLAIGVRGFIGSRNFYKDLRRLYYDICCIRAVDTLAVRHQVLSYETRKEMNPENRTARIVFYNLKLEMAVDAEDKNALVSEGIRPNKHWSDIYVSDDVKSELQFFINYLKNPREYHLKGVRAPKGALMYGPPGTGKTSLAKVVATESNVNFLSVSADELVSGGANKVHETFQVARKYAPAVLFIDEIDAVGFSRNLGAINPALNALLVEIDGFKNLEQKPVFVMAATNLGKSIDEALVRRFDRSFCVDLPKKEGRKWILEKLLNAHKNMFNISEKEVDSLADRSAGKSPANLENVIESALREGIRNNCTVDDDMLDEAFEKSCYGEENDHDSEKEVRHTAYHEAGHAIVHLHYGNTPSYMSVVSRRNFGGYVQWEKLGEHPTKEKLLQLICMSLGGRAAELEFGYGLTPGAASDLKQATDTAKSMVCKYGMYEEEVGLAVISDEELRYNEKAGQVINRILSEQLEQARQIVREERENMEKLVEAVLASKQKYLTKKDLEEIYHG